MKKIIILLGPPASGKGTQARIISRLHGFCHFSTGAMLRRLIKNGNISKRERTTIVKAMAKGALVSDAFIYRLTFNDITHCLSRQSGIILDGAIRSVKQAKIFQKFFDEKLAPEHEIIVIEILLSDHESFSRSTKRRICEKCGEIIPWLEETKNLKKCPECGGELAVRPDDSEEVVRSRIVKQGSKVIKPIARYYKKLGVLKVVDGSGSIDDVAKEIGCVIEGGYKRCKLPAENGCGSCR